MPQSDQFPADLHAPTDWVRQIEGRTVATARWEDGSYGNDAAPSWILMDDAGVVHAQVFYYAVDNAERFESGFDDGPYVAVSIVRNEEIVESCCLPPGVFARAVGAAHAADQLSPADVLRAAFDAASAVPIAWSMP